MSSSSGNGSSASKRLRLGLSKNSVSTTISRMMEGDNDDSSGEDLVASPSLQPTVENSFETINMNDLRDLHDDFPDQPPSPPPVIKKCGGKRKASNANNETRRWTWSGDMAEALILNLSEYKNMKTFEGLDFEADLVQLYADVRTMMAQMFPITDFGPEKIPQKQTESMDKNEMSEYKRKVDKLEKLRKEGYNRIKNKIRELRRGYKQAVDKGTRSGSGRLVAENFDSLKEIWGGCPSVTAVPNGIVSIPLEETRNDHSDTELEDFVSTNEQNVTEQNVVDKGKRKNLQKNLSAHQRDMMLFELTKEELELKRESSEMLKRSLEQTEEAIKGMTESMTAIGNSIKDGLGLLANAFVQSQSQGPAMYPVYNSQPHMSHSYFLSPPQTPQGPSNKTN